ncbi:F0F1 ATP synthase subunit delta [Ramlibacter tataouinensis]|uniref:ATP synthase subunit delta n=1 Tax=Ramlibacter tataouinensis (strain ATCC BAA-407 / DSM 14655 / LMG 21543 / TTB310) TaxID=365046 RepID=F5Y5B9_RAMTT|nr:F0F1 ATP synthase subunit delta [Ramlibacter tataouinensis]AEG91429.1 Candidate F-ATPase, delta chain [Ramlibacter tataouinensis TTB310]
MAELATIARPYAEALFESSKADLNGTAQWLDALAAVAGNAQLLDFAANPRVTDQQVFDLTVGVARVELPPAARNFLRTVIENGRLAALPEVAAQFRALKNSQGGSSDAVVYSAFPIPAASLAEVAGVLERRFRRKLNLTVQEDPSLIGGIRVVVGDEVLDTSVRARLEQMKVALTA